MRDQDLVVREAGQRWQEIRWALFLFPEVRDVQPTPNPDMVRVSYEGSRPYPHVWTTELIQQGFEAEVPAAGISTSLRRAA
jgi:hypothetical protein